MDTQINLLSVNLYDNNLTYISENIKIIVEKFLDKDIQNLIKIGNFRLDDEDSYSYERAGCCFNYRKSYSNTDGCKFAITYYYTGTLLEIRIKFNKNFNNEAAFIDVINNMVTV